MSLPLRTDLKGLNAVMDDPELQLDPAFYKPTYEGGEEEEDSDIEDEPEETLESSSKMKIVEQAVKKASKGISEPTEKAYRTLAASCVDFLRKEGLIGPKAEFFSNQPVARAPTLIVAWIMQRCDSINIDGTTKPTKEIRGSYEHAQKMRASVAFMFSKEHGLGNLTWHQVEGTDRWVGNPCSSTGVSNFMVGLKRKKVQSGEIIATPAKAITSAVLSQLYHFNRRDENWKIKEYKAEKPSASNSLDQAKAGGLVRRMLWACTSLSFLCLLRYDEVLKIKVHDIKLQETDDGVPYLALTLPFRKTHQSGAISPFILWPMPDELQHICPVRAVSEWLLTTKLKHGYLFRRILSGERLSEGQDSAMSRPQFLDFFRDNLVDINIHPKSYGTHSFRRGGCQFLHMELRWPLRKICEWGGWSTDFGYMTIVKYLISESDDPTVRREDYFKPGRRPQLICPTCGRSCECGY